MPAIKLKSSDGVQIKTDTEIAAFSGTIKTMLEYCDLNDEKDSVVPVPNVNSTILRHILAWANHHKNDPTSTIDYVENKGKRTDVISEWDAEFLEKFDQGTLFEIISAANYLDVKGLLAATSQVVTKMVKGKTTEEIRKTFNIKNDFTTAEGDEISDNE